MYNLIAFFLLIACSSYSQPVKGLITNAKGEPLAYTHVIGNKGKEFAITDLNGIFEINSILSDTLFFSMVGYIDKSMHISNDKFTLMKVVLQEQEYDLPQGLVVANNMNYKKNYRVLKAPKGKVNYIRYMNFSGRLAQKITNPSGNEGKIEQVIFRIENTQISTFVRLRIYAIEQGYPGIDLLSKNMLVPVEKGTNSIRIDLSKELIPFPKQGCYVGIDIIKSGNTSSKLLGFKGYRIEAGGYSLVSSSKKWYPDYARGTYASFDVDVKVAFYVSKN